MATSSVKRILAAAAAVFIPALSYGGTLDDAPFTLVAPSADWTLQDSTAQPMGDGVTLAASISNMKERIKSVVIKTVLQSSTGSALDQLCAGVTDSFSNPSVKVLSQADSTFLGFKARKFAYQITMGPHTIYNEAIVFVSDTNGWTIACVGPLDEQKEIDQAFGFYQKK